jgi:N-acyl-L-homoserine lactone synthetase
MLFFHCTHGFFENLHFVNNLYRMTIFKERLEWDAKIDSLVKSMAFDCRMVCLTMREKGADKK